MKILVITRTIAPTSGGGRYSRAVLEEYVKKGIEFRVLTETGSSPDASEMYEDRILLPLNSFVSVLRNISLIRKAMKDCDVVHAFDGWPYAVYAHLALLGKRQTLVVNAVGTYAVAALKMPVKGKFLAAAYRKAVKIFAISEFVKNNVLKYIKLDNLDVAYLGTTPMKMPAQSDLDACKAKYGITSETPVLLTVGALKDRKGQFETVQAVKILKEKYPNILYCIVGTTKGTDVYAGKIKKYVEEEGLMKNVKILSDVRSDAELASLYALSTVFLLNSKYDRNSEHSEGFGLVLLEAAQFGKPVIGSKGSGIPEAMEDGVNGHLVDEVRPELIAQAVEKALANYEMLSRNSRLVAQKFSWDRTASAYLESYKLAQHDIKGDKI